MAVSATSGFPSGLSANAPSLSWKQLATNLAAFSASGHSPSKYRSARAAADVARRLDEGFVSAFGSAAAGLLKISQVFDRRLGFVRGLSKDKRRDKNDCE
jgi:hypothetical protein